METFELSAMVTISIYTEVEAETIKEAIKIAESRYDIEKKEWHDELEKQVWVVDDYDGEPFNIKKV